MQNKYKTNTPEWQLYENAISSKQLSNTYALDAERYTNLSQQAREKAELFFEALGKLDPQAA